MTDTEKETLHAIRKLYKHLRWAAANVETIYNLIKPEEAPPLPAEDPNQYVIQFDDDNS